jgi:hypothetical protein
MREGEDYMLVDKNIYNFWKLKYGKPPIELKRFGIKDENGENNVEIYLKRFNIYPVPNKNFNTIDRYDKNDKNIINTITQPIFCSKT